MRAGENTRERASGESGAVLVLFAVFMSVAILFMAFVIDAGNWFEHKRHLQLQADAAAFAAAGRFEYPCTPEVEKTIYGIAGEYGGASTVTAPVGKSWPAIEPLYNTQVGRTTQANIHELINSKTYFGQHTADNTVEKAPCNPEASMIDVKLTETNLPWFFKALDVPRINAHARVSIVQQKFATAVEPVIESEPKEVRVFYVNDNPDGSDSSYNDELLATGLLTNIGSNEEKGTIKWTDASAPVGVNVTKPHIGVRIALAGKIGALTGTGNEGVSVCTHEYVECFDEDSGVVPPLLNISGYSAEGKGKSEPLTPVAHKVALSTEGANTCNDGYFHNFPGSKVVPNCSLTVSAELDYGSTLTKGITITPEVAYTQGFTGAKEAVKGEPAFAAPATAGKPWVDTGVLVPSVYYANDGSSEINIVVKCKKEAGSPCEKSSKTEETATIKDVQRTYSAGPDGSNRIVDAKVFEPAGSKPVPGEKDAEAFELCETADANKCEHKLAVTIELKGSLEDAAKYFNKEGQPIPPFHIVSGDNDQENDDQFAIACPPTTSTAGIEALYDNALEFGCKGKYTVNTHGGSCTSEKSTQETIEKEEATQKKAREEEEAGRKTRETTEATERSKWLAEESEPKLTKAQRETKEKEESKSHWERLEGEGKVTKAQREAKEKTKVQLEKEEKEGKITRAQRETKEREAETKALWERQEGEARITKAQREAKEVTKAQLEKEEKEFKLTKAQRVAKEAAQAAARKSAEEAETKAREKRIKEEQATKEAKEKQEGAIHECVGLVSTAGVFPNEQTDTANFQHYFAARIEGHPNGTHYYCPNKWVNNNEGGIPIIPSNDSRLIQFFVVPFTVTDFERKNEVSPLVAVETFATFYVTGWGWNNYEAAQGKKEWNPAERRDECSEKLFRALPKAEKEELENETIPLTQREQKEKEKGFDDDTEQPREIVGHLIKYVNALDEAGGTVACKLEGPETCEAALTE